MFFSKICILLGVATCMFLTSHTPQWQPVILTYKWYFNLFGNITSRLISGSGSKLDTQKNGSLIHVKTKNDQTIYNPPTEPEPMLIEVV